MIATRGWIESRGAAFDIDEIDHQWQRLHARVDAAMVSARMVRLIERTRRYSVTLSR